MIPRQRKAIAAAGALAFLAILAGVCSIMQPTRIPLGILLVFVLPGFAIVGAVLPRAGISADEFALASVGASVATSTCVAVALASTVGLSRGSAVVALGSVTIFASVIAWFRTGRSGES